MSGVKTKNPAAWPIPVWVLSIVYFITYMMCFICNLIITGSADRMRLDSKQFVAYLLGQLVFVMSAFLVPVLFTVHTKKIAFITALPLVIVLGANAVNTINVCIHASHYPMYIVILDIVGMFFDLLLATLYIIQMFIKNRVALPLIFTVLYSLYLVYSTLYYGYAIVMNFRHAYNDVTRVLIVIGGLLYLLYALLLAIVYCSAAFSVGKKDAAIEGVNS